MAPHCTKCGVGFSANYCKCWDVFLCLSCLLGHEGGHDVVPSDIVDVCLIHSSEVLDFYCTECVEKFCIRCMFPTHCGHLIVNRFVNDIMIIDFVLFRLD